jgi:hypothetical protein
MGSRRATKAVAAGARDEATRYGTPVARTPAGAAEQEPQ